jgi:filamentous hemagglutinin family protein
MNKISLRVEIKPVLQLLILLCLLPLPALAQVDVDGSTDTSVETPDNSNFTINNGDRAGGNLFHSFGNFSVPTGGSANFNNDLDVDNIINRVTGGNTSNIDGLIKANGGANLFLINPAGIIFGAGARLDIGGSFLGSTADSIVFPNGIEFNATNTSKPLLTINAPIGLNLRENPAAIANNSTANNVGLAVKDGKNLSLFGGDINNDGGRITAPGGRVELGGLTQQGQIGLSENGNSIFPDRTERANVSLSNGALVDVAAGDRGSIAVNAKNVNLSEESILRAGIARGLGTPESQAGNVRIDATDAIAFSQASIILNRVEQNATGSGGNIEIDTKSLSLTGGSLFTASTVGRGKAGNITINAKGAVTIDGVGRSAFLGATLGSTISSNLLSGASGNGGTVDIKADSLSIANGGRVTANTSGFGDAGNINIDVRDSLALGGYTTLPSNTEIQPAYLNFIASEVLSGAVGNGGNINIKAGSLSLDNLSEINTNTRSQGNAGNIVLRVGEALKLADFSGIRSSISPRSVGDGGNIEIQARSLDLTNGAQIATAVVSARGDLPGGQGKGGNITIDTSDSVNIAGYYPTQLPIANNATPSQLIVTEGYSSGLITGTERGASGDAGNITVNTSSFRLADGATLESLTQNDGKGGNVSVNANSFDLTGGGQVVTTAYSQGNAGDIRLNIANNINISGSDPNFANRLAKAQQLAQQVILSSSIVANQGAESGLFANTTPESTGNGGSVVTNSGQFNVSNGAKVSVTSQGLGSGGSIFISAQDLNLNGKASLTAANSAGSGGNITLKIEDLVRFDDNSLISAQASGEADGGNINIDSDFIVATPNQNNDIVANASGGRGGNIEITTEGIFGLEQRRSIPANNTNDIDASSEFGLQGNISIYTPDVQPDDGLVQTPENTIEPDEVLAQACSASLNVADNNSNSLMITGRGGLPQSPTQPLTGETIRVSTQQKVENQGNESVERTGTETVGAKRSMENVSTHISSDRIIPARGMIVNEKGQVILTRYPTPNTQKRNAVSSQFCPG